MYALTRRSAPVPFRPLLRRRRGIGDATSILDQERQWSEPNTYLQSPAFLASQAAAVARECAVNWTPACETGDQIVGYNPAADTKLALRQYCLLNLQNNKLFGQALDTSACDGPLPRAGVLDQADAIATASGHVDIGPVSQATPVPVVFNPQIGKSADTTTTSTAPGGSRTATAQQTVAAVLAIALTNLTRPGQSNFNVGDAWQLVISGPSNSPVIGEATQNGNTLGAQNYGNTDSSGRLTLSGTMALEHAGSWIERWTVGGQTLPLVTFSVTAPAGTQTGTQTGSQGSTSTQTTTTTNYSSAPDASAASPSWFSQSTIFSAIPNWGLVAAALGLGLLAFRGDNG